MSEDTTAIPTVNIDVAHDSVTPRVEAFLLADYAAITESGKPVVCGVFGRILADPETKNTGGFFIFIRVVGLIDIEVPLEIALTNPSSKTIAIGKVELKVEGSKEQTEESEMRLVHVVQRLALNVEAEGMYWFDILYGGKSLGSTAVGISFNKQEKKDGDDGDNKLGS